TGPVDAEVDSRGFAGRSGATRDGLIRTGGGVNRNDTAASQQLRVRSGNREAPPRSGEPAPNLPPNPAPNPAEDVIANGDVQVVAPQQPAIDNTIMAGAQPARGARPPAQPQPQPVNPDGNRLNTNRVDNRSTLVLEARDAAQPGVVIHKSYLRK